MSMLASGACANSYFLTCTIENRRRNMGDFQGAPQVESSAPFCKWAYMVEGPQRIPMSINTGMR